MLLKDLGKLFDVGIRNIDTRSDALTRLVRAGDRFGWSVIGATACIGWTLPAHLGHRITVSWTPFDLLYVWR